VEGAAVQTAQPIQITVSITRQEAYAFISDLARDERFRERLEKDPRTVLAERGIEFETGKEDAVPECVTLPPTEDVEQLLEELGPPDEEGMVNGEALGRACYVVLFAFGFGAMPFIVPDRE
jgi:hypothetical protein